MTRREHLCDYFRKAKISQTAIANKLGVQPSFINMVFNGKASLGNQFAQKLADAYGLSFGWVISGEGSPMPSQSISNGDSKINGNQTISVGSTDAKDELIAELRKQITSLENDKKYLQSLLTSKLL